MDPINLNTRGADAAQKECSILSIKRTESDTPLQTESDLPASLLRRVAGVLLTLPYTQPIQRLVGLSGGLGA